MPTQKKRVYQNAENLPATMVEEETCPAITTANGLKLKRPDAYAGIVQGLVEGTPLTALRKKYQVSPNTVAVVRAREKDVIAACKPIMRGLIGYAAQSAVETFIERLEAGKIPDGVLPIAVGILIDKARAADGEPSQTIEVRRSVSLDEVKAELAALRKTESVEMEVSEVPPADPAAPSPALSESES